jgi:putative ABC transport system ATP-binding protein
MLMPPIIAIKNLNHYYGSGSLEKQILFDISLEIQPGELVILTGPSGSGKTTLLSLIGGLRAPQSGSLQVCNQELCGASEQERAHLRRQVGYIFQAHNLLQFLTVRQNVQMSVELHPMPAHEVSTRAEAMLCAVGLKEQIHAYPDQLSGGQKQRVAVARALAGAPRLVLADEPTAALDSRSGRSVVELMQCLTHEQNCAVLMVTHDHRILDIATRTLHMEDGCLASAIQV